jgi:proteic killer suppression protein
LILSFRDSATEDIFDGKSTRPARAKLPTSLWPVAQRKLDQLDSAEALNDLRVPPGNRLERRRGDRAEQHSIRINSQYRICFAWTGRGAEQVEIVDYH